ncbi:hypothetical protein RhiJN_13950 [Ceratobasidium sp. AG-Ba]|nr:hypothetical protein RhiJN_13950 [Ceratobasidium sp. AG-Ba]
MVPRAMGLRRLTLIFELWVALVTAFPTPVSIRTNTTAHLIFGHTFVPATIPVGTLLHHSRMNHDPPPSPEFFAFDLEHANVFCFYAPCLMFNYAVGRDLQVGYFDGTSAATLPGARDFQDILFNGKFIPDQEYNPWTHAMNMCRWADKVGLDGIVRMEPSFEVILCNIESDLTLVSKLELVYPESIYFPGTPLPKNANSSISQRTSHPRLRAKQPYFPPPTMPVYPPPPGWKGKQLSHLEISYESVRAGMWHNGLPGENRVILDYSRIVSAYDDTYTSLVTARDGVPRSKHRMGSISSRDWERIQAEVHEVLIRDPSPAKINWQLLFQALTDRYSERLEDLRYVLRQSDLDPVEVVANARHKVLIALSPYMVLPRAKSDPVPELSRPRNPSEQSNFDDKNSRSGPDGGWFDRIYEGCATYATAGISQKSSLNVQEQRLFSSIARVQSAICASLVHIWTEAFDSEEKPVFARKMIATWRAEVEQLMEWLDWHTWVKCDPPCGPGTQCVLASWPWEISSGEEDIGPTCRGSLISY